MLDEVNELEWKNNHVAYRNTRSVLLFFVASVIFAYLLYKLYACTRNRTAVWFCREATLMTPTDVGQDDEESTVNISPLTPNDPYRGRTAPLTSRRCILYIYSTNIGTEYFKQCIYSTFFSLQNAVCFIILSYLVPLLFLFYIQGVLKLKKIIPAPKR